MSIWRRVSVLLVLLSLGVQVDLFACGDKFLISGRGTRFQRPKGARAANVLIYADPTSAVGTAIKKEKVEKVLSILGGHHVTMVPTPQKLSTTLSGGRYEVILTAKANKDSVERLAPGASVVPIDDVLKDHAVLDAVDKEVVKRDQDLKTGKR